MNIKHVSNYTAVDSTADPAALAAYMDAVADCDGVESGRALLADRLQVRPGMALLDLGCGPGTQTVALAARLLPGGRAVGMDLSQTMIDEARRRVAGTDLPVEFEVGDALALPFADDTFDACRTERMLIHVPDAPAALAEMARVTRPGGRVGVIDVDIETILFDSTDRALTRRIVESFADSFQDGWIGRRLPRLMVAAGLTRVTVDPYVMSFSPSVIPTVIDGHLAVMLANGSVSVDEAERWRAEVLDQSPSLVKMTMFAVVGVKA